MNRAIISAIALTLAAACVDTSEIAQPLRPLAPTLAGPAFTAVIAKWGGPHYVRAGEFIGVSDNQPPSTNIMAMAPYVCQVDAKLDRFEVWGQVSGPYNATVYQSPSQVYTARSTYVATPIVASVASTSNMGVDDTNSIHCSVGDFLLVGIDADVNPEYFNAFARFVPENP